MHRIRPPRHPAAEAEVEEVSQWDAAVEVVEAASPVAVGVAVAAEPHPLNRMRAQNLNQSRKQQNP